jgi:hypothetical protein
MSMIDPLGLRAVIEAAEKELTTVVAEVDVALSEANATTTIEV